MHGGALYDAIVGLAIVVEDHLGVPLQSEAISGYHLDLDRSRLVVITFLSACAGSGTAQSVAVNLPHDPAGFAIVETCGIDNTSMFFVADKGLIQRHERAVRG